MQLHLHLPRVAMRIHPERSIAQFLQLELAVALDQAAHSKTVRRRADYLPIRASLNGRRRTIDQ